MTATTAASDELTAVLIEDGQRGSRNQRIKLELDGYRVLVRGQAEVRHGLETRSADLVFFDLDPSDGASVDLLQTLRRAASDETSLVIMSDYDAGELGDRGVRLGANENAIKNPLSRGERS